MPSTSKKQHNFMAAVANNPKFAKKVGVSKSVGEEFMQADKSKKMASGGSCKTVAKKEVKSHEKRMHGMKSGGVAKKVTKEMEYDYKTGKKSFTGSTAKRDAHAEKEGKRVAKDLAYDMKKMAKGGLAAGHKSADGCAVKGKTRGMEVKMAKGGMTKKKYC
jgi:hypothetical protein